MLSGSPERDAAGMVLVPHDRADLAVRKLLKTQMEKLRGQITGIMDDSDIEFVHKARVATRRMRSLLGLFQDVMPVRVYKTLSDDLKWIGGLLGEVRDLDIILFNISEIKKLSHFKGEEKRLFVQWMEEHRRPRLDQLILAFESTRFARFERTAGSFIHGPLPRRPRSKDAARPISEVAPLLVGERYKAVLAQGDIVLADPRMKQFHRLRILVKRLRYACEFLSPAFEGGLNHFIEEATGMQDRLGAMQDTVFMREFIDGILGEMQTTAGQNMVFVLGEIYHLQKQTAADYKCRFPEAWGHFISDEGMGRLSSVVKI